jgi:hypothetical protein
MNFNRIPTKKTVDITITIFRLGLGVCLSRYHTITITIHLTALPIILDTYIPHSDTSYRKNLIFKVR